MSFIAKTNLALSVTLTAVAILLAPLMTSLLMKILAGQYVPIDFWDGYPDLHASDIVDFLKSIIFLRDECGAGLNFRQN